MAASTSASSEKEKVSTASQTSDSSSSDTDGSSSGADADTEDSVTTDEELERMVDAATKSEPATKAHEKWVNVSNPAATESSTSTTAATPDAESTSENMGAVDSNETKA